jgi:hypothetical protein
VEIEELVLLLCHFKIGYVVLDNTRSVVLELNSKLSNSWHNNFVGGYDKQIEDRALIGGEFPTIDIKKVQIPLSLQV